MILRIIPFFLAMVAFVSCGGSTASDDGEEDDGIDEDQPSACSTDLPSLNPDAVEKPAGYDGPMYEGPLYETSLQMGDETEDLDVLVSNMNRNNVVRALAMFGIDGEDDLDLEEGSEEGLDNLAAAIEAASCRFVPYFIRGNGEQDSLDTDNLRSVLEAAESRFGSQILRGIGEVELYKESWNLMDADDPALLAVYDLAKEFGINVFGHWAGSPESLGPASNLAQRETSEKSHLEAVFAAYPEIDFLFHLFPTDIETAIFDLMDTYTNFYFSVDADHIMQRIPWQCGLLDCYEDSSDPEAEFIAYFDANVQEMLDQAHERYDALIEDHPDQFMWGSENVGDYSFDPDVYDRYIAFSRAFIGSLPATVQEKIAYANAERVFGPGAP